MKHTTQPKSVRSFDPLTFLSTNGRGREIVSFQKRQTIFAQGDASDGLFFIQKGKVQINVVSDDGKEAILGILSEGDFFGESGLAGQPLRLTTAVATTACILLHVGKKAMIIALNLEPKLSALFMTYLLKRNIRYQEDLVDQLFNSSEKRLARVLLLMARFGKEDTSEMTVQRRVPRLSQEALAEMVGTTRSRVSFFMNRFRKLRFINYDVGDNLLVNSSLLNVILQDDDNGTIDTSDVGTKRTSRATQLREAPAEPGAPPDKERAKRPRLSNIRPG